ncbi:cyclic GMP-AMP synthase DncV-like nucleotidyltransferase [Enterococcus hirae]|uniref:cyclic GMP-AMP synthase DncV-like nucleotidyltransferase n=1 Tax=Enterococcus hirae TaxID=1354 RepID=UPI00391C145A
MLQKEFIDFNDLIKIGNETDVLREKREMLSEDFKKNFPEKCKLSNIEIKSSDISFVSQGSFKLNTTVTSKDNEVDLDLGVIFPLDIIEHEDPRKIKILGKEALEIPGRRFPIIKEPCITIDYVKKGEDWLHLDFPLYAEHQGQLYLARGKEHGNYLWEEADPKELNKYIISKLTSSTGQPRRIVRYLKKWKQNVYSSNDTTEKKPPSIGLTLLVVDSLVENESDLEALRTVFHAIRDRFMIVKNIDGEIVSAKITQNLPVKPHKDVFKNFDRTENHGIAFYKKIDKAVSDLDNALLCDNEHDAATYVAKVLGEEFSIPEKEIKTSQTNIKKEHSFG